MRAYDKVKSIDKADLASAAKELKQNWKHVSAELNRVGTKEVKVVKKAAKKAVSAGGVSWSGAVRSRGGGRGTQPVDLP